MSNRNLNFYGLKAFTLRFSSSSKDSLQSFSHALLFLQPFSALILHSFLIVSHFSGRKDLRIKCLCFLWHHNSLEKVHFYR
jgi:hypothetical protein